VPGPGRPGQVTAAAPAHGCGPSCSGTAASAAPGPAGPAPPALAGHQRCDDPLRASLAHDRAVAASRDAQVTAIEPTRPRSPSRRHRRRGVPPGRRPGRRPPRRPVAGRRGR
jgi:hypothetical protein